MNKKPPGQMPGERGRGAFITLEGIEGAGKSTQVDHMVHKFSRADTDVIATREPGGSPRAEILRNILLSGTIRPLGPVAEAILFAAARIDHIDTTIEPALVSGTFVVCDRFADSTRAYQGASGELDTRFLNTLEQVTLRHVRPDLTLILDLPAELGLARAERRRASNRADRFEAESLRFHRTVRDRFLAIAVENPDRCVVIDATNSEATVARAIWETISGRFPWVGAKKSVPRARTKHA